MKLDLKKKVVVGSRMEEKLKNTGKWQKLQSAILTPLAEYKLRRIEQSGKLYSNTQFIIVWKLQEVMQLLLPGGNAVSMPSFPHTIHAERD